MVIQILFSVICIFIILEAVRKYSSKAIYLPLFLMWSLFWLLILFLIWKPNILNMMATFFQVGRGVDALFYLSLIILFYIIFRISVELESIKQKLAIIVRKIAIIENKRKY